MIEKKPETEETPKPHNWGNTVVRPQSKHNSNGVLLGEMRKEEAARTKEAK